MDSVFVKTMTPQSNGWSLQDFKTLAEILLMIAAPFIGLLALRRNIISNAISKRIEAEEVIENEIKEKCISEIDKINRHTRQTRPLSHKALRSWMERTEIFTQYLYNSRCEIANDLLLLNNFATRLSQRYETETNHVLSTAILRYNKDVYIKILNIINRRIVFVNQDKWWRSVIVFLKSTFGIDPIWHPVPLGFSSRISLDTLYSHYSMLTQITNSPVALSAFLRIANDSRVIVRHLLEKEVYLPIWIPINLPNGLNDFLGDVYFSLVNISVETWTNERSGVFAKGTYRICDDSISLSAIQRRRLNRNWDLFLNIEIDEVQMPWDEIQNPISGKVIEFQISLPYDDAKERFKKLKQALNKAAKQN